MILYSIVPFSDIFPYEFTNEVELTVPIKNGYALYKDINGQKNLESIFSTNPYDYLNYNNFK
ncbi:MAG: YlzJ-like family protein [Oscillospiraceae bacterium]